MLKSRGYKEQIQEQGYVKVPSILSAELLKHAQQHCLRAVLSPNNLENNGKMYSTNTTRGIYAHPVADEILEKLQPSMEQYCGKSLFPTYSYTRFYPKGGGLKKHKDRPSCEYSVTICLDSDYSNLSETNYQWPMYCAGTPLATAPGDGIIYRGCEVAHWREPLRGKFQLQLFLHYVDANGPYADYRYDHRQHLANIHE